MLGLWKKSLATDRSDVRMFACSRVSCTGCQRFLDDAVKATAEYARKKRFSTYTVPPYDHDLEKIPVETPVSPRLSVFERLVACCFGGRRTTTVNPDPKKTIVQARGWKTAPFILGKPIYLHWSLLAAAYELRASVCKWSMFDRMRSIMGRFCCRLDVWRPRSIFTIWTKKWFGEECLSKFALPHTIKLLIKAA